MKLFKFSRLFFIIKRTANYSFMVFFSFFEEYHVKKCKKLYTKLVGYKELRFFSKLFSHNHHTPFAADNYDFRIMAIKCDNERILTFNLKFTDAVWYNNQNIVLNVWDDIQLFVCCKNSNHLLGIYILVTFSLRKYHLSLIIHKYSIIYPFYESVESGPKKVNWRFRKMGKKRFRPWTLRNKIQLDK